MRPIHVLTFMAQHLVTKPEQRQFMYSLANGLENKLAAVRIDDLRVRSAWGACVAPGIDPLGRVKPYEPHQTVIAALNGYLGSIYSCLETTAFINARLNPHDRLKQSFSEQAKKVPEFSFGQNQWLPLFYDLRTQMTHLESRTALQSEESAARRDYRLDEGPNPGAGSRRPCCGPSRSVKHLSRFRAA